MSKLELSVRNTGLISSRVPFKNLTLPIPSTHQVSALSPCIAVETVTDQELCRDHQSLRDLSAQTPGDFLDTVDAVVGAIQSIPHNVPYS
jgi:hypothetical protein